MVSRLSWQAIRLQMLWSRWTFLAIIAGLAILLLAFASQPLLTQLGQQNCEERYKRARTRAESLKVDRTPSMRTGFGNRLTCSAVRRARSMNADSPVRP